ncbi:MAG: TRAP transporter TatT component family protein [Spirochaetaceae bacterium]|jgi:predicted anti-sigma-YlaC factor YlaD|nr:TRAP transporter TatT component family protein [Spirochaetaceae bacterium]
MKKLFLAAFPPLLGLLFVSCSLNKLVINKVSDVLGGSGSSNVFLTDNDPQLVAGAVPFAIKMYETLLEQNPDHAGLILTTGSLFVMYANAFVQGPAEMLPFDEYEEKYFQMDRAKNLYLRGVAILERGIKNKYPGMLGEWGPVDNPAFNRSLAAMKKEDIPLFYWYAAGTISAYSLDAFDIALGLRVPQLVTIMQKAYELDPDYNSGALDEFFLLLYAGLPDGMGGDMEKALVHFQRAVEKSKGQTAGPYVSYAQSIAVKKQDYADFKDKLETALAIDPAANPSNTLINTISRQKARYLMERAPELFLEFEDDDEY